MMTPEEYREAMNGTMAGPTDATVAITYADGHQEHLGVRLDPDIVGTPVSRQWELLARAVRAKLEATEPQVTP